MLDKAVWVIQNRVVWAHYLHLIWTSNRMLNLSFALLCSDVHNNISETMWILILKTSLGKVRLLWATWQSTLSMCRAMDSEFDLLKSSLSPSRTLGSRGRLFSGKSSDSNWSNWKHETNSTCDGVRGTSKRLYSNWWCCYIMNSCCKRSYTASLWHLLAERQSQKQHNDAMCPI